MTSKRRPDGTGGAADNLGNLASVFRGLSGFVEQLQALSRGAEQPQEGQGGDGKGVRAVYGFSVRVGGGGAAKIEPFGNVDLRPGARGAAVDTVREPLTDVFEEDDHVLVIAEMPGVETRQVRYELADGVLTLNAGVGERRYRKELRLPVAVKLDGARAEVRNGVFELRLPRVEAARS